MQGVQAAASQAFGGVSEAGALLQKPGQFLEGQPGQMGLTGLLYSELHHPNFKNLKELITYTLVGYTRSCPPLLKQFLSLVIESWLILIVFFLDDYPVKLGKLHFQLSDLKVSEMMKHL